MKRKILGACIALGAVALPVGTSLVMSTAASDSALCYVGVTIVKKPGVSTTGGVYVETGEYQPTTNCI